MMKCRGCGYNITLVLKDDGKARAVHDAVGAKSVCAQLENTPICWTYGWAASCTADCATFARCCRWLVCSHRQSTSPALGVCAHLEPSANSAPFDCGYSPNKKYYIT
eukprot:2337994-Amphidinium_carterae.1